MSLYRQCSEAAAKLMVKPPEEFGGVFSEIDVVNAAASRGWSTANYGEALRHANQVLGTLYRGRKLARYGPVMLPDGNKDYGRIASKIVYAAAEGGPEVWDTPNGKFSRLMIEDDQIGRQGRRFGTNRNDLAPWDAQEIQSAGTEKDHAHDSQNGTVDTEAFGRKIRQLEADLNAANRRLRELEAENTRLREHTSVPTNGHGTDEAAIRRIAEDVALSLVGDLDERLRTIEQIEQRRAAVYSGSD